MEELQRKFKIVVLFEMIVSRGVIMAAYFWNNMILAACRGR
jgi:hypothetical protein